MEVSKGTPLQCTTAEIAEGRDGSTKTVTIPKGYSCPAKVSNANWLRGEASDERFDITQSVDGAVVTAQRTDKDEGWELHLMISCCKPSTGAAATTQLDGSDSYGRVGGFSATCWNTGKVLHNMLAARLGTIYP